MTLRAGEVEREERGSMGHRAWATSDEYSQEAPRDGLPLPARAAPMVLDGGPVREGLEEPEVAVATEWSELEQVLAGPRRERSGRRRSEPTDRRRGRYVRARMPTGANDVAFDATLRAAALHGPPPAPDAAMRVRVGPDDLREKHRTERVGRLLVFVVDLSGSMGAELLALARRAAGHLLEEAYVMRDRVGLVAFRGVSAEVIFAPTSSAELARTRLASLSSGGKTPLALGLAKGGEMIRRARLTHRSADPVLVVITDGQGNVGSRPGYPSILRELDRVSSELRTLPRLRTLLLDATEDGKNDFQALRLANALGARTLKVHRLRGLSDATLREVLRNV
jgi:magnesium chelatase subunit D